MQLPMRLQRLWPEDLSRQGDPMLDEYVARLTISAWIPTLLQVSRLLWVHSELALTVERGAIPGVRECIPGSTTTTLCAADMGAEGAPSNLSLPSKRFVT